MAMDNVRIAFPEAYANIVKVANNAGNFPVGRFGMNSFYCWNYVAPQHTDNDRSFTISIQLEKEALDDEYNFACTEYNFYIKTEVNTLW